jgi:hypothetical protein
MEAFMKYDIRNQPDEKKKKKLPSAQANHRSAQAISQCRCPSALLQCIARINADQAFVMNASYFYLLKFEASKLRIQKLLHLLSVHHQTAEIVQHLLWFARNICADILRVSERYK